MGVIYLIIAVALDQWWGEPRRWHPLVGFGHMAAALEGWLNRRGRRRWRGLGAVMLLVLPLTTLTAWLVSLPWIGAVISVMTLYWALGSHSLAAHARAVADALRRRDMTAAQQRVSWLVSREPQTMSPSQVAGATVESVLENGSDAVFAPIFWFLLLGAPGVVLYRLVNTLDAMWGYRSPRFQAFGWAAARLDDGLNWLPARLTAVTYGIVGRTGDALRCGWRQGRGWKSANAGWVMAAGAGALGVALGGSAVYDGRREERPILGNGRAPEAADIEGAIGLVRCGLGLWLVVSLVAGAAYVATWG